MKKLDLDPFKPHEIIARTVKSYQIPTELELFIYRYVDENLSDVFHERTALQDSREFYNRYRLSHPEIRRDFREEETHLEGSDLKRHWRDFLVKEYVLHSVLPDSPSSRLAHYLPER
jgi:hypothetical protein